MITDDKFHNNTIGLQNPFSLTFGKEPQQAIPRFLQSEYILNFGL
jgi:hypothetical protein